jgi:DNA repair exonuclease SbcCD nuclease subunit
MKILHFADLHLDASFGTSGMTPGVAIRRREELRGALRRILRLAAEHSVDMVTIAGDLYEQDRCTLDTGNFLRDQFERIAPVPVIIAPGNHDPWVPYSLYRQITWPPNVFVFEESELYPYSMGNITVWGAAHCSPSCRENLIRGVKVPSTGTHLLLLHASDTASVPAAKSACCPLTAKDVADSGFGLALLGHYHGARLALTERPALCYPGSPEPLGFDEVGQHYVLLVEVEDEEPRATLLEFDHRVYATLSVDVSSAVSRENIRDTVIGLSHEQALGQAFVRLHLTGMLHPDVDVDSETLLSDLSEFFAFLDVRNETYPAYDLEALEQDQTVKGAFVRKMVAILQEGDPGQEEVAKEALYLGLRAMDRRELKPR